MTTPRGLLSIALVAALVALPIGTAHADDSHPVAAAAKSDAAKRTTATRGIQAVKLKKGRTVKKDAKRNSEPYAGARPFWVQLPVVVKSNGKYYIKASASVRAHHRPGHHSKSATDQLALTVALLKPGKTVPNKANTTLLETVQAKVENHGVAKLSMRITKSEAATLRALPPEGSDRIYVLLTHAKDTYPEAGADRDLQHAVLGGITSHVLSKKEARKAVATNVKAQKRIEKGKSIVQASGISKSNLNQIYYQGLWLQNNSPFTQGITLTPNINCMAMPIVTGDTGSNNGSDPYTNIPSSQTTWNFTVPANTGSVQIFFNSDPNPNSWEQWYGANNGGPSGSTFNAMQALGNAGRETMNGLQEAAVDPEVYSGEGLLTAGIGAALTFGVSMLVSLIESASACGNYGQFWGVSSTALYVGTPSAVNTVYGTPKSWATGFFPTLGYGNSSAPIGQGANMPNSLPSYGSSNWSAMETMLNAAVGQQVQSTYFHNAGQPAPVANAAGNSQWSGVANFSQGLVQWIYPNPGSCQNNNCNEGGTAVQFGYLMNGYDGVVGPQMQDSPTLNLTTGTDPNTNQPTLYLNCQIPNNGTFVNPFTGSQGSPGAASAPELNSLAGMPGVTSAQFVVSYYAQDSLGNYLYNSNTTSQASYPGPLAGNTAYGAAEYPPTLQASSNSVQLLAMNQANNSTQLGLSIGDLNSLINPSTGQATFPSSFGCVVIPMVGWQNMNVTSSSVWGGNWPFPQVNAGGPLSSPLNNYFNWTNPVNAINLTWTGDPYLSAPASISNNASTTLNTLTAGQTLQAGQTRQSHNGIFSVVQQADGNLVVLEEQSSNPLWASGTTGSGNYTIMQSDGNLVTYTASGLAVWASNTAGNSGAYALIQDEGNLVVYSSTGTALWSTPSAP